MRVESSQHRVFPRSHFNTAADASAAGAAAAARFVMARACVSLHEFLRCGGGVLGRQGPGTGTGTGTGTGIGTANGSRPVESTNSGPDAAIAAAHTVAPCLEAFLSLCWSRNGSRSTPSPKPGARPTSWRGEDPDAADGGGGED